MKHIPEYTKISNLSIKTRQETGIKKNSLSLRASVFQRRYRLTPAHAKLVDGLIGGGAE